MTTMIRRRATACSTVIILAVFGSMTVYAQKSPVVAAAVAASGPVEANAAPSVDREPRQVRLLVGRSTIVEPGTPVTRVSLTSADIADVVVTSSSQLLLNGKVAGTTSMFVWERGGSVRRYEIVVQRDLMRLTEQIKDLFPSENIEVRNNGTKIVLAGTASNKAVIDNVISLATGFVEKKEDVISLLQPRDATPNNQVLLRVRFAEVNRSAMTELGASFFTGPNGYKNFLGRTTTEQFPAPTFDQGKLTFSDFLNLFLFDQKNQLGGVVQALQTKGLLQTLAEPNLVAESGKEASFLAGGEFPVPIAQSSSGTVAITVQYKEFGVRLNFLPVVNGNRVHLKVRPEVSTLDFANAVVLQGFRIPALATRRTETELELESGQSFAIAGLLSNSVTSSLQKIPGIGDIPVLGLLFKSKALQKDQTELVVMITPEILPRSSSGLTNRLPRTPESYLPPVPEKKTVEPPPPAFTPLRMDAKPDPLPSPRPTGVTAAPANDPASAAAAVQALTPNTRRVVHDDQANQAGGAASASVAVAAPAPSVSRPLTADERKRLDKQRKQDQEKAKHDAAASAKWQAELSKQQQEQAKKDAEAAAKLQKAQAKRDADAAAKAAKAQAEADRKRQKALDDAAKSN